MSTVTTLAKGGTSGVAGETITVRRWEHEIDIASAVTAGLATTDYVVVVNIPANTYFTVEQVEVVTALSLGAGARIDLGDSGSATVFVNNATTLTAGTDLTIASRTGNASNGAVYTSADTLRCKVTGGTIASGKLRFVGTIMSAARNAPMTT